MERENQTSLILVFSEHSSPRLQYIVDHVFGTIAKLPVECTHDLDRFINYEGKKICYAVEKHSTDAIHIYPNGLLVEDSIATQKISISQWNGLPVFFNSPGDIPFDLFSASFYLITRYEEYLPHQRDEYRRYAHQQSIAFQNGFLQQPLIEQWIKTFCQAFDLPYGRRFHVQISYDIDQAWKWKHKGFWRNAGGWIRDVLTYNKSDLLKRWRVCLGDEPDPFDAYDRMLSKQAIWFFLVAKKNGTYDKHILPRREALQNLLKTMRSSAGIHPSWQARMNDQMLNEEMKTFQTITGSQALKARYHYLAFNLPKGYQRLIEQGIQHDHSMGYGTINGFRASTSIPFKWFDLSTNKTTDLTVHPFCWMDATSYYQQHSSPEKALEELEAYKKSLDAVGGVMQLIWHNNFLGTDPAFEGWTALFERFNRSLL